MRDWPKKFGVTLREGKLRGLEWRDYIRDWLAVNRSVGKAIVNKPKTRASRPAGPVIPRLAKILHECRASMHNPATGVMFHNGNGECSDMDQLVQLDGMQATLDVLGNGPAVPAYEVKGKVLNC